MVTTCLPSYQPDLLVRREIDVTYAGEGVFNLTGDRQTKYVELDPGDTARYLVSLVNAGNLVNQFTLKGPAGANGWAVKYTSMESTLRFDGSAAAVDTGNWGPGPQWTVEAWVSPSAVPAGRRTILGGFGGCHDWGVTLQDGQFGVAIRPPGDCTATLRSGTAAALNTWHHVAGTCDGATAVLYVDGVVVASGPVDPNYQPYANTRIGGEVCCAGNNFPGLIAEARVWGRALSAAEVRSRMGQILTGTEAGLLGYWHLNEVGGGQAVDATGNGHTGTLTGGAAWDTRPVDVTSRLTGPGWTGDPLMPGGSVNLWIDVTPDTSVPGGLTYEALLTAISAADASKGDAVKLVTTLLASGSQPESRLYTTTADFERGVLVGVDDLTKSDQVQLSLEATTLPFIWVPNSSEGTASKVDTRTGRELARYRTCPPGINGNPSRTTVDLFGNCYVANRNAATIVKIGLYESGQFVDRNGDHLIQTSHDANGDGNITPDEMLPWGQDECVLFEVVVIPGQEGTYLPGAQTLQYIDNYWNPGPRGLAVDAKGNVWVGAHDTMMFYYLDGKTGQILKSVDVSSVGHTSYGAVIDSQGILWSSGYRESGQNSVLRMNPVDYSFSVINFNFHTYGLGLDRDNHLYVSGHQESKLARINILTTNVDWIVDGYYRSRGVAVTEDGDVWVACSQDGVVARFSHEGHVKTTIPVGPEPTGVSIDASGKVWAVNNGNDYIHRIDPATSQVDLEKRILGSTHYGYSDMTGIIARNETTRLGTWTVIHNSKIPNAAWGLLTWHTDDPAGTNVTIRVRSSNDQARWSDWESATNAVRLLTTPAGKYLEVEVTFQATGDGKSPILYDLLIQPLRVGGPELTATLLGDGRVAISWEPPATGTYQLEYIDSLGSGGAWAPLTVQPVLVNGRNVVTVTASPAKRFYRLHAQ
jgi:sugar lactone lactonase YvrE